MLLWVALKIACGAKGEACWHHAGTGVVGQWIFADSSVLNGGPASGPRPKLECKNGFSGGTAQRLRFVEFMELVAEVKS